MPYVYGQFLEHAGGLVYGSLWCEMLDDRKFYYDVTNKVPENPNAGGRGFGGFPGRRNVGPGQVEPGRSDGFRRNGHEQSFCW